jgi:2-octaprenyl-6-methoxyphenol hydroxylase
MSVIIAGGGIVGTTLALAISHYTNGSLPVTLIEKNKASNYGSKGRRTIATAAGTYEQMLKIGIWEDIQRYATPITHISISENGFPDNFTMVAEDYSLSSFGYVLNLYHANSKLFSNLETSSGVTVIDSASVLSVLRKASSVQVQLSNGKNLEGLLLIAADGSRSSIATNLGIQWKIRDYKQFAVTCSLSTQKYCPNHAFEYFTRDGLVALLPESDNYSSLVWCCPISLRKKIEGWGDDEFLNRLQHKFGTSLGKFTYASQRLYFPLSLRIATNQISHRLALVGNAAQTIHPVAGQGFNLGMRDAISMAKSLSSAHSRKQDYGTYSFLHDYQLRRQQDRDKIIGITDNLVDLFSSQELLHSLMRSLGMIIVSRSTYLKHQVVKHMLGYLK